MNWMEIIAVIFGLMSVWFVVRQSIWCWPTGLVQVSFYVVIFFQVKLYFDFGLHLIYIVLHIYGWYHWLHGGANHGKLPVTRLGISAMGGWLLVVFGATALGGFVMAANTDAAVPYGDAFTTFGSLVAMWLQARKRLQSWLFWIAIDVIAIGIYFYKDLVLTSGLYAVFLILSIVGYINWRRSLESADETTPVASNSDGLA